MDRFRFVRDMPVRRKLIMIILMVSGMALAGAGAAFLTYDWISTRDLFAEQLEVMARVVGDQASATVEFRQEPQAAAILGTLKAEAQIMAAALYGRDGRLFARYVRAGQGAALVPERPGPEGRSFLSGDLLVFEPIVSEGERIGTIHLRSDMAAAWQRLKVDMGVFALILAAASFASYLLALRLGKVVVVPVQRLAGAIRSLAERKDYSVRVGTYGRDELGQLIDGFNDMVTQIQSRDASLAKAHAELEGRVQERTRDLKAANSELESFSYSVSHDLRAPLRTIDGYSQLLLNEYFETLDARGRDFLQRIAAGAGKMGHLIDAFLALAKISRAELTIAPVDLSALAMEIGAELRRAFPDQAVTFTVAEGLAVRGDTTLLRIALGNLLSNAWKFASKKPHPVIEVGKAPKEGVEAFYVRDNGAGFDMEFAHKLFKPFERLHAEKDFRGTGVGLATVQRIIARHGGRVWAESVLDAGATFYFTLGEGSPHDPL